MPSPSMSVPRRTTAYSPPLVPGESPFGEVRQADDGRLGPRAAEACCHDAESVRVPGVPHLGDERVQVRAVLRPFLVDDGTPEPLLVEPDGEVRVDLGCDDVGARAADDDQVGLLELLVLEVDVEFDRERLWEV